MTIQFDTIVPQYVPDVMIETDLKSGLNSLPDTTKKLLLVGTKLSTGSQAAGVVKQFTSVSEAISYWGEGSRLAVMAEKALNIAPMAPMYGVAYAEAGGGVQAFGTIALTGPASGPGTLTVYIGGRRVSVGVASLESATTIGDRLAAAINALHNAPFTAANVTGTVTVTARNKGPEGNSIRMRGSITAAGTTATIAATLTSGATAGDPTSVLAGTEADRYHLICMDTDDSTVLTALKTHVEKQSGPSVKLWCMGIVGAVGTGSATGTIANANDSYRCQIAWLKSANEPVFEVAATFAAERARVTEPNRSLDDNVIKGLTSVADETAWANRADEEAALKDGITPLRSNRNGTVTVVRSVITRHTAPIAYVDHNLTELSDYEDTFVIEQFTNKMKGKPMKSLSPAGTPIVVTPARAQSLLYECLKKLDKMDYRQGTDADNKAGLLLAEPNATDPNRMDLAWPWRPVYQAHVIAMRKTYTTP